MRIFVAVKIGEELQKEILAWAKNFENLHLRWLTDSNLHVTLVPPWDEEEENIKLIEEKLVKVSGLKPFSVSFNSVSYGPSPRNPRLIWAAGRPSVEILRLRDEVFKALGWPADLSFRLHLTLARFDPRYFSQFKIKHLNERVSWHTQIKSFVLLQSLGRSQYQTLAEYLLTKRSLS